MMNIKRNFAVSKIWQGDPCLPYAPWDGLNCTHNAVTDSPRIISLNLSNNSLTGDIPDFLAELPSLRTIDLRSNKLTGRVPVGLRKREVNGSLYLSMDGNPDLCIYSPCKTHHQWKKIVVILVAASSAVFIFTAIAIFCKIKLKNRGFPDENIKSTFMKSNSQRFTYSEVVDMTCNFQKNIGEGGSGTVYYGCLKDGNPVAVKILKKSSAVSLKLFHTEAELLTRLHHRNLVSLIGYCEEGTIMALIYEYMASGNLQHRLSEENARVLCWKDRLQVAIDAAQGLEYLHSGCKPQIVHRDLKTSNILLDDKLNAKISDFGISREFVDGSQCSALTTDVKGTHGYVDPEYFNTRRLTEKSDVYSYGVVLLELITGKPCIMRTSEYAIHIIAWTTPMLESGNIENIVDKRLEGHFSSNCAWKALEIAMECVSITGIQRPSMNKVLNDLKDSLAMEVSQERKNEKVNYRYDHPTLDHVDDSIATADTSIEMGPSAR